VNLDVSNSKCHVDMFRDVTDQAKGNLFFTEITTRDLRRRGTTMEVISDNSSSRFELSIHSRASLQSARISLVNDIANSLVSTQQMKLSDMVSHTESVMARSFVTSTAAVHIRHYIPSTTVPICELY
jgi:hypothetical protein